MQDGQPRRIHISTDMFPEEKRLAMWREVYGRGIARVDIEPLTEEPFHADVTFNLLPDVAIASGSRSAAHYRVTQELLKDPRDIIAVSILRSGEASAIQFGNELALAHVLSKVDVNLEDFPGDFRAQINLFVRVQRPCERNGSLHHSRRGGRNRVGGLWRGR